MNIWSYRILKFLSISLSSILIGYLFFQNQIFTPHQTPFQFLISGPLIALFIIAQEISKKALLYTSFFSLLTLIILMRPDTPPSISKWILYILTLTLSVTLSLNLTQLQTRHPLVKFLIWPLIFTSLTLTAFLLQTLLTQSPYHPTMATNSCQIAALLGTATALSHHLTPPLKTPSSKDE